MDAVICNAGVMGGPLLVTRQGFERQMAADGFAALSRPDAGFSLVFLRTGLASFKAPRGFVRVDALPRNALGKVQKQQLPAWTTA